MPKETAEKVQKIKVIDQMLEDFAGDEFDEFEEHYDDMSKNHKHYSADEDPLMLDELY